MGGHDSEAACVFNCSCVCDCSVMAVESDAQISSTRKEKGKGILDFSRGLAILAG
jgi:hypothetical protein